jgi:hypothetical protein
MTGIGFLTKPLNLTARNAEDAEEKREDAEEDGIVARNGRIV